MEDRGTRPLAPRLAVALVAGALAAWLGYELVLEGRLGTPPPVRLVRNLHVDRAFRARDELLAERDGGRPRDRLGRFPIPPEVAVQLDATIDGVTRVTDPDVLYVKRPGLNHTVNFPEHPEGGWRVWVNSLGLRGPEPAPSPDRRVLVTGDSHTEGACRLRERYTELLQARLSEASGEAVEVVNAGVGGYDFYQYLGTLERLERLDPDVFVVTVYGGNDFSGSVVLHHFWNGTRPVPLTDGYKRRIETALELSKIGLAQAFTQILFFDEHPAERAAALDAATGVTREIARQCHERRIELLVVYLPPMIDVQRELYEPWVTNMVRALDLDEQALHVSDRLADEWIADARAAGIDLLDLRPAFRASKEPLYWTSDHHIDLAGQALVAAKLFDRLL